MPKAMAMVSFDAAPVEVLIGGGAFIVSAAAFLLLQAKAFNEAQQQQPAPEQEASAPPLPRRNAVLVFGATGRVGRQLVAELLQAGRTVVAAARSADKARPLFAEQGLTEGRHPNGTGILFLESGVDVTDPVTLTPDLFAGVDQVVSAVGSLFGRLPDGSSGFIDGMTSERVDATGIANIAAAAAQFLPPPRRQQDVVQPMRTAEDLAQWQRLDDVIMGGSSSSGLEVAEDGSGVVWRGELILEGGGFCGARTLPAPMDLSAYDGIALRIRGDGQTFKLNIKTDTFSEPEDTYQATFDAPPAGDWATVYLPWHEFVPVKRARTLPGGPPLDPASIRQFGLVYSRFAFNTFPNPAHAPGPFELHIEGGIQAFTSPRPQLLMVSSAGVERNARIGDDAEARKADIPIVQLNPGGVLNHKYTGEAAVRASGLAYAVLRPTGMSDEVGGEGPALLECSQGDRISGKIKRSEVANLVASALSLPAASNKTLEVRRSEAADAQGRSMGSGDMLRLFLAAAPDAQRTRIGLEPFPSPAPLPAPPTPERVQEILADTRVQAAQARNVSERMRASEEAAAMKSVTAGEGEGGAASDEVLAVREWIRKWRAGNLERQLPQVGQVSALQE